MEFILAEIVRRAISTAFQVLGNSVGHGREQQPDLQRLLSSHLLQVANWSRDIQLFGMPKPLEIDTTVPLSFETIPRKFRGTRPSERISEESLLEQVGHAVVLGDPGSGKTTLMKRLVRRLLLDEPTEHDSRFEYPILVRLRLIESKSPIGVVIADAIGLKYRVEIFEAAADAKKYRFLVGDEQLDIVLGSLLDATGAIIFLDGLDEIPSVHRRSMEDSILEFSLRLTRSRIILSCRSGDYQRNLGRFTLLELCPLDKEQVCAIAGMWLAEPGEFLAALDSVPYGDLAERPLFLCQLLVYFKNIGYLPDQPASVYRSTTRLMLEDWDRRRGVTRVSKYSRFSPDDKHEFLSSLAHELTYKLRSTAFTSDDLALAYRQVCSSFDLPKSEFRQVAEEIETHTGIIVQSGPETYEFSHLSLQEYLCAHYLVRDPFSELLIGYLRDYPAPIAVAVSIAASPSNWLAGLLLREDVPIVAGRVVRSFLSRLVQERPRFSLSLGLGLASLFLLSGANERMQEVDDYLAVKPVRASIERVLSRYILKDTDLFNSAVICVDPKQEHDVRPWHAPSSFCLPRAAVGAIEDALGKSIQDTFAPPGQSVLPIGDHEAE